MYGKHRRNKCAAPQSTRHAFQRDKQKDHCDRMKKNVRKMVGSGAQPEELTIQHVRNGSHGVPVHGMDVRECPRDTRHTQSAGYVRVFIDIMRVVVVNEVVPQRLAENTPREQRQADANPEPRRLAACCGRRNRLRLDPMHVRRWF